MALAMVLSLSHIPADSRVLRQCRSLSGAGLDVVGIGTAALDGSIGSAEPNVLRHHVLCGAPRWDAPARFRAGLRLLMNRPFLTEDRAFALARQLPGIDGLVSGARTFLASPAARAARIRLVVANDWTSLPAAIAVHRETNASFHYDTHELAVSEHWERRIWRLLFPPLIRRIEETALKQARSVSCVSSGIARRLAETYKLALPPAVVRNVPDKPPLAPKPVGRPIKVIYHGLLKSNRGLDDLLLSAARWSDEFHLTIRGRAPNPRFGEELRRRVASLGLEARVAVVDATAPDQVICAANDADIGVFLPPIESLQNRYALPNKLFEYLHAGLMVIVPGGTDMGDLVAGAGAGLALDPPAASRLAELFPSLTPDLVMRHKEAAHAAAAQLCWATEQHRFLRALGLAIS